MPERDVSEKHLISTYPHLKARERKYTATAYPTK
jgi:hypothetical protein